MATSSPLKLAFMVFLLLTASAAWAQSCPRDNDDNPDVAAAASTLRGKVVLHHELRTWLGLKLDGPACGETELELTFDSSAKWRHAESLRNCRVTATGVIFDGLTGYYSTLYAIQNAVIQPEEFCHPYPISPDPARFTVPNSLRRYRVSIKIDTRGRGHTDVQVRKSFRRRLSGPRLVYVSYWLNGTGDFVWLGCADDFSVASMSGPPGSFFRESGGAFPYGVRLDEEGVNKIRFVCRRDSANTKSVN